MKIHSNKKLPKSQDQDFINYLLLLRFGRTNNLHKCKPILNFKSISAITKLSLSYVR